MEKRERVYIAIDLKSFYASVECVARGLDPLTANLVVADASRTEKTICLAVSPSLKAYGIAGRARLFEVVQKVKEINAERKRSAPNHTLTGSSCNDPELKANPSLALSYIAAPPRMAHYMKCGTKIYNIYLRFVAPEDIHVYSIDEVFIDATNYLAATGMSAREFCITMIRAVHKETGITATAGIAPNLFLCKVAMDIVAKHIPPDSNGVRIAELDEATYRRTLWSHRPLTDFWRVGAGIAAKLEKCGIYTMGDIALCSAGRSSDYYNEDLLYEMFGVNAELLIDHAWGFEPCTIADIKAYRPEVRSVGEGQVLSASYEWDKARLVACEMVDGLMLQLVGKRLVTDQIVLTVGYDVENLTGERKYSGEVATDRYGRKIPKHAHGTANLGRFTSSSKIAIAAVSDLFDSVVDRDLTVRRIFVTATHVTPEENIGFGAGAYQLDMFSHGEEEKVSAACAKEKKVQLAVVGIKKKFGKNAIVKGISLEEGATAIERNGRIGGHKA